MKAITFYKYGQPEVLQLEEVPKPIPHDGEALIKIDATTVNSGDWRVRKADPFLVRLFFGLSKPKISILGTAFSGIIEATGESVTNIKAGDEVYGISDDKMGAYAEYLTIPANGSITYKPKNLSHGEAAALVFGGHTALHFLREAGVSSNSHVLVYGASGSVGSSAVQIAKHYGAKVTGVCSTANIDMVKSIGADNVIDYTKTDIYTIKEKFDVVYETVNKTEVSKIAKLCKPKGTLILGAAMVKEMLQGMMLSMGGKVKVVMGVAKTSADDMKFLADLADSGKLRPLIDKTYPLEKTAEAHAYVEAGHKKGNVVISIE